MPCCLPQIISLLRYKSAKGLSLLTFGGFCVFQIFTILHGILTEDFLLAGGYILSFISCGTVTILIIYYKHLKTK
ncbi:MAG: hypothetical protein H0T84_04145 [Tatlockia sp.]|nr:hypothetical protein [Tatlockia sp.]